MAEVEKRVNERLKSPTPAKGTPPAAKSPKEMTKEEYAAYKKSMGIY
jgi:hypothetical protein